MTHHTHRAVASLSRTVGWTHCVAKPGSCCSGAAHGGVTHVETCSCGAIRRTESNGSHRMRGGWESPVVAWRIGSPLDGSIVGTAASGDQYYISGCGSFWAMRVWRKAERRWDGQTQSFGSKAEAKQAAEAQGK